MVQQDNVVLRVFFFLPKLKRVPDLRSQTIKCMVAGFGQKGRRWWLMGNKGDDAQIDLEGNFSFTAFNFLKLHVIISFFRYS